MTGLGLPCRTYNAFGLLTLHTFITAMKSTNIILHGFHDDSERVAVLVDLHVQSGCCITEERASLWQRRAFRNETQHNECCHGTITAHVVQDGKVAVFLFILTSIMHINTLHNCRGSH